jgi:hypothetical protein
MKKFFTCTISFICWITVMKTATASPLNLGFDESRLWKSPSLDFWSIDHAIEVDFLKYDMKLSQFEGGIVVCPPYPEWPFPKPIPEPKPFPSCPCPFPVDLADYLSRSEHRFLLSENWLDNRAWDQIKLEITSLKLSEVYRYSGYPGYSDPVLHNAERLPGAELLILRTFGR